MYINVFQKIKNELKLWTSFIIISFPNSILGDKLRKRFWAKHIKGRNITILRNANLTEPELLEIGDNFIMGEEVLIHPENSRGVFIGNNVGLAIRTYIRAANHSFDSTGVPIIEQGHNCAIINYRDKEYSIVIEDDVCTGANVMILSGAMIGKGSFIAAGSVVSFPVPPYSIVAGNPGRVISNRQKRKEVQNA